MTEFVVDTFYENIRAPMWVNFSNPDEVEGDSWFDTLSETDDADRVRMMPTEFEIAQLLPDQVFDANTPEKPRSPATRAPIVEAVEPPVFSDEEDEGEDEDPAEGCEDEVMLDVNPVAPEIEDATMSDSTEQTEPVAASPVEQLPTADVHSTAEVAPQLEQTADAPEITQTIALPPSPQMPKDSADPAIEEAPEAIEKATEATEATENVDLSSAIELKEDDGSEETMNDGEAAAESEKTAEVQEESLPSDCVAELQEPLSPAVEDCDNTELQQPESALTEITPETDASLLTSAAADEPAQDVVEDEPVQDGAIEESAMETATEETPQDSLMQDSPMQESPTEEFLMEESPVHESLESHVTPSRDSAILELVKPRDISTPPSEEEALEEASTSADSGMNLSAIVEEGEEEDDFLVHDDDEMMAEIDNKEAAMMAEIQLKRKALEEKKAEAEMLEVKVTSGAASSSHPGLRTPTLQEAFQKRRKKAKTSKPMTLTEPEEFSFSTEARSKARIPDRRKSYSSASDSEASLQRAWTGHITEPKEFHFRTEERVQLRRSMRQSELSAALNEPVTPSRRQWTGELTEPREFNFSTDERMQLRSMNKAPIVSSDEKELKECRHFKAYPLNRKVLESAGDIGVPRLAKRKLTRPQSPALATRDRSYLRKRLRGEVDDEEEAGSGFDSGTDCQVDFAARFGREADQPNKLRRLSLTEPKPFAFQTEQRAAMRQSIRPSRAEEPTTPRTCYSSDCESSMTNSAQRRASAKRTRRRKRATEQAEPLKLTEPRPFSFATEERALLKTPTKRRQMVDTAAEDSYAESEAAKKAFSSFDRFANDGRGRGEQTEKTKKRRRSRSLEPRKLTEPQPFRFQTEQRAQQAIVSKPRDASVSSENSTNLFAPLSKVTKTSGKRRRGEHEAAPKRKKALTKVSDAKLNAANNQAASLDKTAKKQSFSRLMKPTAASTASSTASKAIQKRTASRTHAMKTRASRRKLTAPKSPMLQTRLRAAAIHGMRDL